MALIGHGLKVAGYSAISLGIVDSAKTAGDLLFDLGHSGKGDMGLSGKE